MAAAQAPAFISSGTSKKLAQLVAQAPEAERPLLRTGMADFLASGMVHDQRRLNQLVVFMPQNYGFILDPQHNINKVIEPSYPQNYANNIRSFRKKMRATLDEFIKISSSPFKTIVNEIRFDELEYSGSRNKIFYINGTMRFPIAAKDKRSPKELAEKLLRTLKELPNKKKWETELKDIANKETAVVKEFALEKVAATPEQIEATPNYQNYSTSLDKLITLKSKGYILKPGIKKVMVMFEKGSYKFRDTLFMGTDTEDTDLRKFFQKLKP